ATSLGYNVDRFKLIAFMISAALAGTAGATKSVVFQFAALTGVHWSMSGEVVLMTLVGGVGTLFGPVVGAFAIVIMYSELSTMGSWIDVIIGTIFVLCVLIFRRGVVGELARLVQLRAIPGKPRNNNAPTTDGRPSRQVAFSTDSAASRPLPA